MVKTRFSSSASSSASSKRPRRSSSSLATHKNKRRSTLAMTKRTRKLCREKSFEEQSRIPLTLIQERGNRDSNSHSKLELKNSSLGQSRNPKAKAAKNVRRYKSESPAGGCSRKTFSKKAGAAMEEGFSERNSNSSKVIRMNRLRQVTSSTIRETTEACTEERSYDQMKEANHENGWTSEQDVALQSAYLEVQPSSNFWFEVSKKVPGKTAKDCFDRFYSAHPTPPITQHRSKRISTESPLRTITFVSPMSSLNCKDRFGRGKQGLLKAHQTVRHILRQQKVADGTYEADVFSSVEGLESLLQNCKSRTISPLPALTGMDSESTITNTAACTGNGNEVWQSGSSKHKTRSDNDWNQQYSSSASQCPVLSPEVLKAERNPSRLDRFLDILHLRRVHKQKSSSLKHIRQGHDSLNPESSRSTLCVAAAREAILTDVKEVLRTSLQKTLIEEETSILSDQVEDESSLLSE